MSIRGFATIVFLFALAAFSAVTVKADAAVSVRVYDLTSQMCRDNPSLPGCFIEHHNVRAPISITDTVVVPTATASAAADLRDGTLRLFTSATPNVGLASAGAFIGDQLTFSSGLGGPNVFSITIGMNVHGSITNAPGEFVDAILSMGATNERRVYTGDGTFSDTFTLTLTGVQSGGVYNFSAQMGTFGNSGIKDFSNTASVFLILPTGVTFTSQSGAFLTQTPTAVPEPATILLLGSGLAGITAKRFRRRKLN